MIYVPFWNFIANRLPDWLAPNLMTLMGLIFPIISSVAIAYYSMDFTAVVPHWVWLLCTFGSFWFQTIDAVDGKQARRINNCSPIGQLLDHNLD